MSLKQACNCILPAGALAAAGVLAWGDTLRGASAGRVDRPAVAVTVILGVWSLLDYYARKFWRDTRKAGFETTVTAIAEGVRAEMAGRLGGDAQHAPGPRKGA